MIDKTRRRELLRAYAERKPQTGVFAVRCPAANAAWVGWSTSLDKRQNSLWFQLRAGGSPHADMQALWSTHGEDAFSYDILEQIVISPLLFVKSM